MLSIVLTAVMLLGLYSCKKEFHQSDNQRVQTVADLNGGDFGAIIDKFEGREDLSGRERYYLASAYSRQGGVDVYSLYSVMEIQLFHKNALEWSNLSKEKNPYLKFMKSQKGGKEAERIKKREERWQKYEPKLIEKHNIMPELNAAVVKAQLEEDSPRYENQPEIDYGEMEFLRDHEPVRVEYERLEKEELTTDEKVNQLDDFVNAMYEERYKIERAKEEAAYLNNSYDTTYVRPDYRLNGALWIINKFYQGRWELADMKRDYLYPETSNDLVPTNVKWEMLYMNVLWNTYEAIPMMKKLPALTEEQQQSIGKALEAYYQLLDDKEFKDVAMKNIVVLTSVSLLSIYKTSFDLESVDGMQDLYCSFEPDSILNSYKVIRDRIFFLYKTLDKTGIDLTKYDKHRGHIEQLKKQVPDELNQEQRDQFIAGVDKFKVESCFND